MALCLLIVSPAALGMGFGALRVQSALGQPLQAQIELLYVTPNERASLAVHVADEQRYRQFGLVRNSRVSFIHVRAAHSQTISDRVVFNLTSAQPMNTPVLELLVVAQTQRGELLRQYTVLLDPARRPDAAGGVTAERVSQYGPVRTGESLWNIASTFKYADVSIEQMLVAIYRQNPKAFAGSMGRLRVGSELAIPTVADVRLVDSATAHGQVASARERRLNRLVTAVAQQQATMAAGPSAAAAGVGRLRLVTPRAGIDDDPYASTGAATETGVGAVAPGTGGPAFGVLAMPAVFSGSTVISSAANKHTPSQHRGAAGPGPAVAARAANGFGRLAVAPTEFSTAQRRRYTPERVRTAAAPVHDTASPAQQPMHNVQSAQQQNTAAASAQAAAGDRAATQAASMSADHGAWLRTVLWAVAAVCVVFAALLWLHSRGRRSRVTALAGVAAARTRPAHGPD